jgi:23S rRNA (uracil1939-C5)-methyltransferase
MVNSSLGKSALVKSEADRNKDVLTTDNTDIYEIEIIRLASDGTGVGYLDGKATFVPGLLPGEIGRVRIRERKKRYQRAELLEILKTSPERQTPLCKAYSQCGGCALQHMNYEYTLFWKRQWVGDALRRLGGLTDVKVEPVIGLENPWRYRNKAVLHWDAEGRLGYYKAKTNEVIRFEDCLLLSEATNERIRSLQKLLGNNHPDIKKAIFRESSSGEGLVILEGENSVCLTDKELAKHNFNQSLNSARNRSLKKDINLARDMEENSEEEIEGKTKGVHLLETIDNLCFRVSPQAFLQVNPQQTEKLYSLVLDFAQLQGTEQVWDLYCGVGTITLLLAQQAARVVGIEENPQAVQDAILNAQQNGFKNVAYRQGKVEEELAKLAELPDLVVVDPPRSGMDKLVIEKLLELKPLKIIYVSCNPATLARDLKMLVCGETNDGARESRESNERENTTVRGTYMLEKVQPVDMFAWSHHVECVTLMSKVEK